MGHSGRGKHPEQYRAPSWPWAAMDVSNDKGLQARLVPSYTPLHGENPKRCAEVLACEVIARDGDPFGYVKSGYIQLRGRVLPVTK
jgi:hypothetical protein